MIYYPEDIATADVRQLRSMYHTVSSEIEDLQEELKVIERALRAAWDAECEE